MRVIAVVSVVPTYEYVVGWNCQSRESVVGLLVDERLHPCSPIDNQLAISHLQRQSYSTLTSAALASAEMIAFLDDTTILEA